LNPMRIEKTVKSLATAAVAVLCAVAMAREDAAKISADGIRVPIYQGDSDVPAAILSAEHARPIGTRFELKGVRLEWLGVSVSDIKGVVTTPTAVYDRSTKKVDGNEWVKYRSEPMDLDGVGFDIDQIKQVIHIRSQVRVEIKGKLETLKQREASSKRTGKLKVKPATIARLAVVAGGLNKPSGKTAVATSNPTAREKKWKWGLAEWLWVAFGAGLGLFLLLVAISHLKQNR